MRNQRGIAVKILVADSGSQDGTLDVCKFWGVPTIYVPPGNMYHAINEGLRQMDTEWVTYLNSDDMVYPNSYARMVAAGEKQHASVVYGDCDFVDIEGRFLHTLKSPPPKRVPGMYRRFCQGFKQPAAIFRRSVFQNLGGFDERYRLISDTDFFYRATKSNYASARVGRPAVAAFRLHASQLSEREAANMQQETKAWLEEIKLPEASLWDRFDMLYWRIQNSPIYLWRLMKQRP